MHTRLVLAVLPVALLGLGAASAVAAPKAKPFAMTYSASAPVAALGAGCNNTVQQARDLREFKIPAAGKLKVDLSKFLGDWDLHVALNGSPIGESEEVQPLDGDSESVAVKIKKAGTLTIIACNYSGGPTGTVDLKYTP